MTSAPHANAGDAVPADSVHDLESRLAAVYAQALAGRTYRELAERLGVNHETLRRMILARSCNLKVLAALHLHTDVNLNWLLMGVGEPKRTCDRRAHLARATPSELCAALADKLDVGARPAARTPAPKPMTLTGNATNAATA